MNTAANIERNEADIRTVRWSNSLRALLREVITENVPTFLLETWMDC
jgi:hypothetical protein